MMSFATVSTFLAVILMASATSKRGIFDTYSDYGVSYEFNAPKPAPSPAEIASAIQAAREASAGVTAAQKRVHEAKEEVLHQQHLAEEKRSQSALALQKAEAAAAVQQQEARAAAAALVEAQQRLAQSKAQVAEMQKMAAIKEAQAAAIIGKSAAAAAAEIQRNDDTARKLSAIQHSNALTIKQANAGKEGTLTAAAAAVAASADRAQQVAWVAAPKFVQYHPWG